MRQRQWIRLIGVVMLAAMLCSIGAVGQPNAQTPTRRPQGVRHSIPRVSPKRQSLQEAMAWAVPMMSYGAAAVSPDGQWVAAPIRNLGHVGLFHINDVAPVRVLRAAGDPSVQRDVFSIAFSPNGQLLAVGLTDATVRLFRVSDGRELRILSEHPSAVSSVAFSPDGQWLASAPGNNNTFNLWQVSDGTLVRSPSGHTGSVNAVAFSPNGQLLASGSMDTTVKLWQVSDGALVNTLTGHTGGVNAVAFSPNGQLLASGSGDTTVKLWQVSDGALVNILTGRDMKGTAGSVNAVAFSPDGQTLLSGGQRGYLFLWDVNSGGQMHLFAVGLNTVVVVSVAFLPDGQTFVAGNVPGEGLYGYGGNPAALFNVNSSVAPPIRYIGSTVGSWDSGKTVGSWDSVAYAPDGQTVVVGSGAGRIGDFGGFIALRASDGSVVRSFGSAISTHGYGRPTTHVAISPDGQLVAGVSHWLSSSSIVDAFVYRLSDGTLVREWDALNLENYCTFSPDSQFVVLLESATDSIKFFNISDGALARTIVRPEFRFLSQVVFSPDGQLMAVTGRIFGNFTAGILRVSDGSIVHNFGNIGATTLAFSADGQTLAVGSATSLTLFQVSDGTPLWTAPTAASRSVAFSPNGQLLAVAGTGEVKLINASDGSAAGALTGVIGDVRSVAFSPDGRFLLSAGTEVVAWRVGAGGPGFVRAEVPDVTVGRTRDFVLDASASASSGTIVSYEWDLDNDGDFDDATGAQVHHHFDRLGAFIVRVQVTDNEGRVASDSALVTVRPNVDLVVASLAVEPSSGLSDGAPITLKAVVRNDGPDSLTLPFTVQFEAGGRVVGQTSVSRLLAGAETEAAVATKARGGTTQFKVVADPANAVTEIAEDNNAQTLDVAAIPAPELSVTDLTLTPNANLSDGQQVQVAATIANTGTSTTSNFDVAVFVDGGLFASRTVNGMANGQSQVITIPLKVHVSQRVVKVVMDEGDKVGESNEDNNAREVNLPDIPPPDLTVTDLKTLPASGITLGQKVRLQATVSNAGATTLTPFRVDFTLADGTARSPFPTVGNGLRAVPVAGLPGGQSQTVEVVVTAEAGEQNLQVVVDPMRVVLESNENNNTASLNFGVAVPDLQLTKLTLTPDAGFTSGDTISVAATVQLNGSGRLITSVAVRFDDNGAKVGTDRWLDAGLTAGQTVTLGFSWRATPGAHTLRVMADPDNKLSESDENNNATSLSLPDVPFPDLAVAANLNPPDVGLGFPFFVEGQVKNEGAMTHQPFTVKAQVLNQDNVAQDKFAIDWNLKKFPNGLGANGTADFRLQLVRSKAAKTVRVSVTFDGNVPDANPGNDRVDLALSDAPLPDYAMTGIEATPPDNPNYGQPITFRATVTNNGASILFQGGVAIAFFVNDRRVGTGTIGSLGNGASTTATAKWVIDQPLNNPTIRAAILPDIPDADNTNNETQSTLNLVVAPIDLIPVGVSITPDNVMAGGQGSCRATFRKIAGPDYVGSVAVRAIVDGVDLGERAAQVRLTEDNPEATIALDWTTMPGDTRAVRLIVDPRNSLPESDENNNTLDANVDYSVAAPDFVADSVNFEPQTDVKQGDTVRVTVGIKNGGAGAWGLSVPVRVHFNTGFERVVNVNGFAAGETKTFTFDWTAAPGGNNLLLVQIDPDQRVPESDEKNNALNQRLPFTVAPRATLQLSLAAPPSTNAPGDSLALNWSLSSSQGEEKVTMSLTAPGLPDGAATVEPTSGILAVNGRLSGQVRIVLPSNMGQTQNFTLTLQAQVGAETVTAQQNLRVEAVPVISDLRPLNETRLGANSTVFSWRTQIASSSEVFIKRPVDSDYQRFAGERGTLHTVRVTDLRPNSTYLFYVRSAGSSGEARSEERRIFVSKAIAFTQSEYAAEVKRDYDQRLSVRIVNTDSRAHEVKVELVDNPYPDAVAGLIGEGTVDEPATLLAGQALMVTFAGHFQDAQGSDYAFRIRVRTVGESEELSDDAIVKMRVRQPDVNLRVEQIAEDPLTLVKTFRVTNVGRDAATDVTIRPSDVAQGPVGMQPMVEHAFIAAGQSLEFKVFPLLLPPDFRPVTAADVVNATLTFESHPQTQADRKFDMFLRLNGVEIGSLQNTIPDGTYAFPVPPSVLYPEGRGRLSRTLNQLTVGNGRRAVPPSTVGNGLRAVPPSTVNRQPSTLPEQVVEVPPDLARKMQSRLDAGTSLEVRYANRSMQIPIAFPKRQSVNGQKLFIVSKGPRVVVQEVEAVHCVNQSRVKVDFTNPLFDADLEILKNNFNDGHYWNVSKFKLGVCLDNYRVAVEAANEEEAKQKAEKLCETLTKKPPKMPKSVTVEVIGDGPGPPFVVYCKPVTVRATVSLEEGEPPPGAGFTLFGNGDPSISLRLVGGGAGFAVLEGEWKPQNLITADAGNVVTDRQGVSSVPVIVWAEITTCTETALGQTTTHLKAPDIKIKFEKINGKPASEVLNGDTFKTAYEPGGTTVTIIGRVVCADDETKGVPAQVRIESALVPFGELLVFRRDGTTNAEKLYATRDTAGTGIFAFDYPARVPGDLSLDFHAEFKVPNGMTPTTADRHLSTVITLEKVKLEATKDGYKFYDSPDGDSQPLEVGGLQDTQYLVVHVEALQPTNDKRLEWKPLDGATVQIIGGGSRETGLDGKGIARLEVGAGAGEREVTIRLVPELDVKIVSFPEAYVADPKERGLFFVFLGKNIQIQRDEGGFPQATGELYAKRKFRVKLVDVKAGSGISVKGKVSPGSPGEGIAQNDPMLVSPRHEMDYVPPASLPPNVPAVEITVEAEDITEDQNKPLYKGTMTLGVYREAFLSFSKIGFEEIKEINIDLVPGAGNTMVLPGAVKGTVQLSEQDARRINGVIVRATTGKGDKQTTTQGQPPDAGKFRLSLDASGPESELSKPIGMQFVPSVNQVQTRVKKFNDLGYNTPAYSDEHGYQSVFAYRSDLRTETDPNELYRVLEAIDRLSAALDISLDAHKDVKQYIRDQVAGLIDVVLFVFGEKIFESVGKLVKVGKGVGKSSYLTDFIGKKLTPHMKDTQNLPVVMKAIEDSIARHGGLTDEAIQSTKDFVKTLTQNDDTAKAVADELTDFRGRVANEVSASFSLLKLEVVNATKTMLKRVGVELTAGQEKLLDMVIGSLQQALGITTDIVSLYDRLLDGIAEQLLFKHRGEMQKLFGDGMRQLGHYDFQGDTPTLVAEIKQHQEAIGSVKDFYDKWTSPLSSLASTLSQHVQTRTEVLTGQESVFRKMVLGSVGVVEGFFPIKSALQLKFAPIALEYTQKLQTYSWKDARGESHDTPKDVAQMFQLYAEMATVTAFIPHLSPVPKRSPQLDEYANVINQVKTALQEGNLENALQLSSALRQATAVVSDECSAKEAAVGAALNTEAAPQNPPIGRIIREASQAASRAFDARYKCLLMVNSFLMGEAEESRAEGVAAANDALQQTQNAVGVLDAALQQLKNLGVNLPAVLFTTHREEIIAPNQRRITFTVSNIGGADSPATMLKLVAASGVSLSQRDFNLPALQPGGSHSFDVTVQVPSRPSGFDYVRATLEEFNVDFVPALVFFGSSDTVPPTIANLVPAPDSNVATLSPSVSASMVDNMTGIDLSSARMTLDGQRVNATYDVRTHRFTFQTENLTEGQHTILVETKDFDGNPAQQEWRFNVDPNATVEVTDVNFIPNPFSPNGDGMDDWAQVFFRLNGTAILTVSIVDGQGKTAQTLAAEQQFTQGEHTLLWDGITNEDMPAPEGSYNIQITVGQQAKQSRTAPSPNLPREGGGVSAPLPLREGLGEGAQPRKARIKYQNAMAANGMSLTRSALNVTSVTLSSDTVRLTKQTASLSFNLSQMANVKIKIYSGDKTNDDGYLVRTLTLNNTPRGQNMMEWDGRDDGGRYVPPAPYSFGIEADNVVSTTSVPFAGTVQVQSLPDLLPITFRTEKASTQTKLIATIRNAGGLDASNVKVRFLAGETSLGDVTISSLSAGSETTVDQLVSLGLSSQTLAVVVDPDEQMDELEEFNNRLETTTAQDTTRVTQVLPAGLSMVSVPLRLMNPSPAAAFSFPSPAESKVATWDTQTTKYFVADEIAAIELGRGYFIKLPAQQTLQWEGIPAESNEVFTIALQPGWNLLGNPRLVDLIWDLSALKVRVNGQTLALKDALPYVEDFAWAFQLDANNPNTGKYLLIYDRSIIPSITNKLTPIQGFWVLAKVPCELILPAAAQANTSKTLKQRKPSRNDWLATLTAEANGAKDNVLFGASSAERNGNKLQIAKPPLAPGQGDVQVFLVPADVTQTDSLRYIGVDVRRSLADKEEWQLVVRTAQPNADVTLRWNDLGNAPRPLRFRLIDEATGARRYMRTLNGYTFHTGAAGEERKFRIELDATSIAGRLLNHLSARNNGGLGAHFSFVLSQPATLTARIITPTGKVAAVVARGMEGKQGLNTLTWNGKASSGASLPRGVYIIEVSAMTEEGQEMKDVRTFALR